MADRFESVRWKLTRAQKLCDEMNAALQSLKDAWTTEVRDDGDGYRSVYIATVSPQVAEVMAQVSVCYGDSVHNLRTACDHFAYAVVPNPGPDTMFPIWRPRKDPAGVPSATEMRTAVKSKMPGIPVALADAIVATEPYNTGKGHSLWVAHVLDVADKHHSLTRAVLAAAGLQLNFAPTLEAMTAGWEKPVKLDVDDASKFVINLNVAEPDRLEVGTKLYSEPAEDSAGSLLDKNAVTHVFRIMLDSDIALGTVPRFADEILDQIGRDTTRLLNDLMAIA